MVSPDTSSDARRTQIDSLRRLGGPGRVQEAFRMSEQARRISIEGLLRRTPGMSAEEARARVLRRALGNDLYEAAYGAASE